MTLQGSGKTTSSLLNDLYIYMKKAPEQSHSLLNVFLRGEEGLLALWPGDEHRGVVVSDAVVWDGVTGAAPVLDVLLPLTEAVQRLACVVVDLQGRLEKRQKERKYSQKLIYVFKS